MFDRVSWPNGNFVSRPKRLNPCCFGLFNFSLTATDVRPIARRIPTCRKPVDKYVRFLPEIENRDRAMHPRQQKLQVISGKLAASRSMEISQANGRRRFTIVRLERIISRPKVSRQSAGKRQVNVPNQYRRIRRTDWRIRLNEGDREENCGRKNKTEYAKPATTRTGDKIHVSRRQVGGEHLWQARNFWHSAFQTRNSRGLI
jgi:hypothetical protein